MSSPVLTVILAVKDASKKQLNPCLWAIAALRNSKHVNLLIISSGVFPGVPDECLQYFNAVSLIDTPPLGVYSAYNRGLDENLHGFVLFLGVDDLVLPGLDTVLDSILSRNMDPDLVACRAYMQGIGVSAPSGIRGALIFKNWCQQGLLYNARLFQKKRFITKYKVQADHKFNLELMADRNLNVIFNSEIIAHFASGGMTSSYTDWLFREDMPEIVRQSYGVMYWVIALAKRTIADIVKGSPAVRKLKSAQTDSNKE